MFTFLYNCFSSSNTKLNTNDTSGNIIETILHQEIKEIISIEQIQIEEPEKVKEEPEKVKEEPEKVKEEQEKVKEEPEKVKEEPEKVKEEPEKEETVEEEIVTETKL